MGVWNINAATDLISSMAQSTIITESNVNNNLAAGVAADTSDYARILAEKISEIDSQMNNTQNQSDNAQNNYSQNESKSSGNSMSAIETLRRIMPDGSIRIVTYEDGEIKGSLELRPHLVMTPDFSAPPNPTSGELDVKPEKRLSLAALLMA